MNPNYPDYPASLSTKVLFDIHSDFRISQYLSPNCKVKLANNTMSTYYFSMLNSTDVLLSATINSAACFANTNYVMSLGRIYTHIPDSLILNPSLGTYLSTSTLTVTQSQINNLSPKNSLNIDFIFLTSFVDQTYGNTYYDYVVQSVTIYKSAVPLMIQFVGVPNI